LCSTTTRENLATHKDQIPFERLPRTIKDAITITRDLSIQFLWVDALCIVQDSLDGEDWQRESAKMGNIYGNAYVTIAAEISENCTDGFLNECNRARAALLQEIPLRLPNGEVSGAVFVCAPILDENCFLMRRARAFQEQRLSRRVLHYRAGGLYLCYREGTWFESVALSFGNT
jgi:Heterokaryon incompatibility protein (HET)